jgi:L-alanine-DL-glutamate epimerase-like enolase superfamily enzyme
MPESRIPITDVTARAFKIPTDLPEADGALSWNSTTLVTVHMQAGASQGFGYTYADACIVPLINNLLAGHLCGRDVIDIPQLNAGLWRAVRNLGRSGLVACAISAIDLALWDLKARCLGLNLTQLLGRRRDRVDIYGSGGFTSYSNDQLKRQLSGWVEYDGCRAVKMKIGSDPAADPARIKAAKEAIGGNMLFVDANGACSARQAIVMMAMLEQHDVRWFEEPGHYAKASIFCSPAIARRVLICTPPAPRLRHLEWFHDHVRIEHMLFDGAPKSHNGMLEPDISPPGNGLNFKFQDAEKYAV